MYVDSLLRTQFGKPSGAFGSQFMRPLLNFVNMRLMNTAVDLLDAQPNDVVMDIGFGGGYSLLALADRVTRGQVTGVDYSQEMVDGAANLIQQRHLEGRLRVECADVATLPFENETFDKVLTVNSVYYWSDVARGLREIARVMKPHGKLAVGFRSRTSLRLFTLAWPGFALYEPREFAEIMEKAGFKVLRVEHRDWWRVPDMVVVVGERK